MARRPKPWWRAQCNSYYVTIGGVQHPLGEEKKEAYKLFHELMAKPAKRRTAGGSVLAVLDTFLEYSQKNNAVRTYEWYLRHCQSFIESIPKSLRVTELKPHHLQSWIDSHDGWADGNKHGAARAVQRAFRWAAKMGHIEINPIAYFEKPRPGQRDTVIAEGAFDEILGYAKDGAFRDLLFTAWDTGPRPQELLAVQAKDVDLSNARWVFPVTESKGKKMQRVVYLPDRALEITKRLVLKYPEGPLFRNVYGRPWTPSSVNCRFCRLQKKIGKKHCLYEIRHTFATRALERGVDSVTVAILMGHVDSQMISRVYSHLTQNPQYLLKEATKAAG